MFTMKIVDTDAFLDMPATAQNLYFHLNMRADDDGFIDKARRIMRDVRATEDDLKILLAKSFLIEFEGGVYVIKHWWMHNTLQKDRYHATSYIEEKNMLKVKKNKAYSLNDNGMITECYQNDNAGLGLDIDLDKGLDIDKGKDKKCDTELTDFNYEGAWKSTYNIYPKKKNAASAKTEWMNILLKYSKDKHFDIAHDIFLATKKYINDYKKTNSDDETFRFIPSYDVFLKEDCEDFMCQLEKETEND